MVDSLCTFQPVGAGSPIAIGSDDCWVKISTTETREVYEVHARYVRNESGDSKIETSGDVRAAAETYAATLAVSLGLTSLDDQNFHGIKIAVPAQGSVSGTLENPYTDLEVSGLYLTSIDHSDDGWRAYEMVLVFEKPRTDQVGSSATPITFDPDPAGGAVSIGNANGYIIISRDDKIRRYRVVTTYNAANRAAAETYVNGLFATFNVKELDPFDTPIGTQFVPAQDATKGTLANPITSLSVADLYCVSIEHDDQGNNSYQIIAEFQQSIYTAVSNPLTDNRIVRYKTIEIGNLPGVIEINLDDPGFMIATVRAQYRSTAAAVVNYADTLATALGFEDIFPVRLPRGSAGSRGVVKSYNATAGTLALSVQSVSHSSMWLQHISSKLVREGIIEVELTFIKSR